MDISLKSCSNNPTAVLFASEFPASEKIFASALAKAAKFGADLMIFHVYDSLDIAASEASKTRRYQYAAASPSPRLLLF